MASRDALIAYANELLDLEAYPDHGPMGLQVVGAEMVSKIACGVSASRELFERAAGAGAQLLLVHHGLFWDRDPRVVDRVLRGRLEALFRADITLASYHLALDAHPEIGNNVLLCRELGIAPEQRFDEVGFGGPVAMPSTVEELAGRVAEKLGRRPLVFAHGPASIRRVAVCSGGAARLVQAAAADGYDCYLTGEAAEPSQEASRELGIHFVAAGHYATETLGVRALASELGARFGLPWEFLDLPNPV
jgi:dinuclear metal center YbgI/SA1388 family protein